MTGHTATATPTEVEELTSRAREVHATDADTAGRRAPLGPVGRGARIVVGVAFIPLAVVWLGAGWDDAVIGLVVVPEVAVGLMALRARLSPKPLSLGLLGHPLSMAILTPLLVLPATAGATTLFYGASVLVAAGRRSGGSELTAISNAVLRRDDDVGDMFAPIDSVEEPAQRVLKGRWPTLFGIAAGLLVAQVLDVGVGLSLVTFYIAAVYLPIGAVRGQLRGLGLITVEIAGVLGFGALALAGLLADRHLAQYLLATALLGHAFWDLAHHRADRVVPRWYAESCVGLDVILAAAVLALP